jgi:hypothetical protein
LLAKNLRVKPSKESSQEDFDMILQYTVRVYTTHDSKAASECVLGGGHTEKSESDEGWKLLISNQKERKINCIKDGNNNYKVMHNHSSV